jgi:hypothetical protein
MRKARTFIAVLLALAVVVVPTAASMAVPAPQAATAAAPAAMVDCEHHQHGNTLPQKAPPAADHCLVMVNCGLCCVTLSGIGVVPLSHDIGMGTALEAVRLSGPSLSWLTTPPLRPPRV